MENVDHYESKKLAQCFIARLEECIPIPEDVYKNLKPIGNNMVAVVPGGAKKVSLFLTNATQILFVRLILDKSSLNEDFFTSLREKLKNLNMANLFSTGLCFKDDVCVWEGVFEYDDDSNFEEVKIGLSAVTHVNRAKFDKIKI